MIARARWGTTLTFALAGMLTGVWVARLPAIAERFDLDNGLVGLTLLAWGLSALVTMQAMRGLMVRLGSHVLLRVASPLAAISLVGLALAPNYTTLLITLIFDGMVFGIMDVAMNSQAVTVERAHGSSIMNGMHAGWSVGALSGALLGWGTVALGMSFRGTFLVGAVIAIPASIALGFTYLPDAAAKVAKAAKRAKLPRVVYLIGALAFAAFLVEGSIADWSGLYLIGELGATEAVAALGYPLFELAMLIGRLFGDRLRIRFGTLAMLVGSGVSTAIALVGLIAVPGFVGGLVVMFITGLVVATVIPITMSLAGEAGGEQSGAAVAQTGVLGYTGLLLGPVVLGFVADASSIRMALWIVVGFAVAIAVGSRWVVRPRQGEKPAAVDAEYANAA
ncbi:MAG: MFS transporter [Longispora sp.]|nr:MFS transporter [Longispora sp. (in: high G+C Gram-positive bacteria)]